MNKDQEQMLIETHAFCRMNHKALYGEAGLIKRVTTGEAAFKTARAIGIGLCTIVGIFIAIVTLAVS